MTPKSEKTSYLKKIPPFYFFILAISPIIISFLIHMKGMRRLSNNIPGHGMSKKRVKILKSLNY